MLSLGALYQYAGDHGPPHLPALCSVHYHHCGSHTFHVTKSRIIIIIIYYSYYHNKISYNSGSTLSHGSVQSVV